MTTGTSSSDSSASACAPSNKPNAVVVFVGSAGYAGFFPVASGTVGSAVALALFWIIPPLQDWIVLLPCILVSLAIGIPIASAMEKHYGEDPSEVVWDEVVGQWIALLLLPPIWYLWVAAFFVFRVFDIIKPPPANVFDRMRGGFGIMMDDVIAGIYANLVIQLVVIVFSLRYS
jgi:phosphatidylglycerophosphatase A